MEIERAPLWDRLVDAFVVFLVFLAFDIVRGEYDWTVLVVTPVLFFLIMVVVDAARGRFTE